MQNVDWEKLFLSYEGRIGRRDFWIGVLVLWAVYISLNIVFSSLFASLLGIVLIYPNFAVLVKRCHDRGKSGWWSLLILIPILGAIWAIIDLGILEGDADDNPYGPDPRG
ncbi:MAG: DUF805 domain-containing protein [Parvularculaceae bacterium]